MEVKEPGNGETVEKIRYSEDTHRFFLQAEFMPPGENAKINMRIRISKVEFDSIISQLRKKNDKIVFSKRANGLPMMLNTGYPIVSMDVDVEEKSKLIIEPGKDDLNKITKDKRH